MALNTDKLLALKAFYMGDAIAKKPTIRNYALAMVGAAIEQLQIRPNQQDQNRLAFYHILRAEILRHEGEPLQDRLEARSICERINSRMYELFMVIEHATESFKKLYGINTLHIADEGIKRGHGYKVDGEAIMYKYNDYALSALGVHEEDLSERDKHFLKSVTLKTMLDKHNITYTQWKAGPNFE